MTVLLEVSGPGLVSDPGLGLVGVAGTMLVCDPTLILSDFETDSLLLSVTEHFIVYVPVIVGAAH